MNGLTGPSPPVTPGSADRLLGRGYQGAVYLRQGPDGACIVKTPIGRGIARVARRAMLRREHAVYQRLQGIRGVPRCEGLVGDDLVLEFVEGRSLRELKPVGEDRERLFADLLGLIRAIHAAGVAHGDLKRKDNILVTADGHPVVIDFGTAITVDAGAGAVRRWLFRQVCRTDLNAWFKLKYQRQSRDVEPADARLYRPTMPEKVARVLRRAWRFLTLRRHRRRG
ncbi:MAG: hypothetical protein IT486_03815 [Gammaproteobacteria bacterium]|nr:hypothetical protein [Gammaproteobacteria bacterium]